MTFGYAKNVSSCPTHGAKEAPGSIMVVPRYLPLSLAGQPKTQFSLHPDWTGRP